MSQMYWGPTAKTTSWQLEIGKKSSQNYLFGPDNPRRPYFYLVTELPKPPDTWTIPFEVAPWWFLTNRFHISHFTIHWSRSTCAPPPYSEDTYLFLSILRPMVFPNQSIIKISVQSKYRLHMTRFTVNTSCWWTPPAPPKKTHRHPRPASQIQSPSGTHIDRDDQVTNHPVLLDFSQYIRFLQSPQHISTVTH